MKKLASIGLSLLLVGILSACGGGEKAQEPAPAADNKQAEQPAAEQPAQQPAAGGTVDAAAAEEKFKSTCAACHGADLSGGAGPNLQQVGSKYSKDDIVGIITNGKGAMPPGMLKGEDAEVVAAWLAEKK